MNCKVCNAEASFFYKGKVLNKYEIDYFKCNTCGFIQTEKPHWLNEAYADAIADLDIGLVSRNIELSIVTEKIISGFFDKAKYFLDYGGGYGMFVRLMRDKGFEFYRYDTHCENIFAKYFDVSDIESKKFDLITAFEVFEHLEDPNNEVRKMFDFAPSILFSTLLAPSSAEEFGKWWYRAPLSGQHISFYTKESLKFMARKNNKKLYTNSFNLHLFTDKEFDNTLFNNALSPRKKHILERISGKFFSETEVNKRESLLEKDYKLIESKIVNHNK
jgi:hypothetical protein